MKKYLLIFAISFTGCTHQEIMPDQSDRDPRLSLSSDPDMYYIEQIVVIKRCFNMVVDTVDSCSKDTGICYGQAHKKSVPSERTYSKIQQGKKKGDGYQYCHIYRKDNFDHLDAYFIYDYKEKSKPSK